MTLTLPPTFTAAHRRALEWLPEDGSWRTRPGREFSPAVNSLGLYHRDIAESEWGRFNREAKPNTHSRPGFRWRLTPAGIALIKKAKGQ